VDEHGFLRHAFLWKTFLLNLLNWHKKALMFGIEQMGTTATSFMDGPCDDFDRYPGKLPTRAIK